MLTCAKALVTGRDQTYSCPRCSSNYRVWCPSSIRIAGFRAGVLYLSVPANLSAKRGERAEVHLPWQSCREVEVNSAGVITLGQVKLHLWESRQLVYCFLPSAPLADGPVPCSQFWKTMQRCVKPSLFSGL